VFLCTAAAGHGIEYPYFVYSVQHHSELQKVRGTIVRGICCSRMHKLSNNCTEYIAVVVMMIMMTMMMMLMVVVMMMSRNRMGGCGMDTAGSG
jgi:hypothetical protein